jgi:hypothetical protein
MAKRRVAIIVALILVTMGLAAGGAQALLVYTYSGATSQHYPTRPSPSVSIEVDRAKQHIYFIEIAYKCSRTDSHGWIFGDYPSAARAKINSKGDFKYVQKSSRYHLSWIKGHVTKRRITGSFAAKHACNATGTFTARLDGHIQV